MLAQAWAFSKSFHSADHKTTGLPSVFGSPWLGPVAHLKEHLSRALRPVERSAVSLVLPRGSVRVHDLFRDHPPLREFRFQQYSRISRRQLALVGPALQQSPRSPGPPNACTATGLRREANKRVPRTTTAHWSSRSLRGVRGRERRPWQFFLLSI